MKSVWNSTHRLDASRVQCSNGEPFLQVHGQPLAARGGLSTTSQPLSPPSQAMDETNTHLSRMCPYHLSYSTSALFAAPTERTISNGSSTIPMFMTSEDPIPRLYIALPPQNRRSFLGLRRAVHIVAPCQSPSVADGLNTSLHMTYHGGYRIRCPCDFEHRHRERVKVLAKALGCFVRILELVGGFLGNVPGHPGNLAVSVLSSVHGTADNRALLDAAGIDPDKLFEIQLVEDCHQIQATEELLRRSAASNGHPTITGDLHGIIVDGRTIWVCRKCHECLQKGHPLDDRDFLTLPQYIPLISIGPEVRVTLQNALSVTLLTKSLSRTSKTKKLIIHIDSRYFEAPERAEQTKSNSITNLFVNLGQAVQRQKDLVHLEIHGNSESDKIYDGLNAVFNCRSLEILRVSGIRILQGKNIKMRCRKLKELSLHRVPLNVEQTAKRLWKLVGVSSALVRLKLTQVRFTTDTLSMNKSKETLTQFTRLESLDLSSNDLEGQEAADLVRMALSGDNPKLRWLDLSGNKKIGKNGCQRVLGLLVGKKCWLDKFKMEGTSIDLRDSHAISTYLSFWRHEM